MSKPAAAIPWAAVGLCVGVAVGFAWGRTAKSEIGRSVTTRVDGGKVSVTLDLKQAAAAGLPDLLQQWVNG